MAQLTVREDEVRRLAVDGLSNDEIAASLGISRRTVETHMRAVLHKTGARRRAQLATLDLQGNKITDGPSGLEPAIVVNMHDVPPPQQRHGLTDCERRLSRYADAVRGLVDRQSALFEERVEITLVVGEQDGQDFVVERRWTRPRPYLVYRILGPILSWPEGPLFGLEDLALVCTVNGQDTHVDVHSVWDVDGRPLVMILFQPGLQAETEWVLRYRSPKLWNPLRSSGEDTLTWATATHDQRYPSKIDELILKVVFPVSWTGERLTEQSNLGVIHTERLPTGQAQVTWRDEAPSVGAYHWVLQGSAAN